MNRDSLVALFEKCARRRENSCHCQEIFVIGDLHADIHCAKQWVSRRNPVESRGILDPPQSQKKSHDDVGIYLSILARVIIMQICIHIFISLQIYICTQDPI